MELRASGEKEFCKEGLILDFFQQFPKFETKDSGVLIPKCLCPAPAPFWHVLTAFYALHSPERWDSVASVATDLFCYFEEYGVDPNSVENFYPYHARFLKQMQEGVSPNEYLAHPIEVCVALYCLLWAKGKDLEEKNKSMEVLREEKILELKEWEDEWNLE